MNVQIATAASHYRYGLGERSVITAVGSAAVEELTGNREVSSRPSHVNLTQTAFGLDSREPRFAGLRQADGLAAASHARAVE